jgi:hypothetical protein
MADKATTALKRRGSSRAMEGTILPNDDAESLRSYHFEISVVYEWKRRAMF